MKTTTQLNGVPASTSSWRINWALWLSVVLGLICFPRFGECQTTIECGETINGTITNNGQSVTYYYSGISGEKVIFDVAGFNGSSYTVTADIRDPNGKLLATIAQGGPQTTNLTLGISDTFAIIVHDSGYNHTGPYGLCVQHVTGGGCAATALSCGKTTNSQITLSGQMDAYGFYGNAGETVMVDVAGFSGSSYSVTADIYDPSGKRLATIAQGGPETTNLTLGSSGTFTILVHSSGYNHTGNYGLSVQKLTGGGCATTWLSCGQTVNGQITLLGQMDAYGFDGNAGEAVIFDVAGFSGSSYTVTADIYDPTAKLLASIAQGGPQTTNLTLGISGTFTILVHSSGYNHLGSYGLATTCIGQTTVSVSATTPNASDLGPTSGVFTVSRSGPTKGALTNYFSLGGTAINGVDYSTLSSPVVIPAGASSTTLAVTPILYSARNSSVTVVLTLNTNPFYNIGSPSSATVTIAQIPAPILSVAPYPIPQVNLGSTLQVTFSVTETNVPPGQLVFTNISSPPGVVLNPTTGVWTWTPATTGTYTNMIGVYDMNAPSFGATTNFNVLVSEFNVAPVLPVIPTQTLSALGLLTVTNAATDSDIASTLSYVLTNSPPGATISPNGVINWTPPVQIQSPSNYTITTLATSTDARDSVHPQLSTKNSFTVVVTNPSVFVSATSPNASDLGPVPGVFTITRAGGTNGPMTIDYNLSGTASNGVDYVMTTGSVIMPAGALSTPVTIMPILYSSPTNSRTVVLTLSPNSFYNLGSPDTASLNINQIPPPTLIVPTSPIVYLGSNLTVTNFVANTPIPASQFAFTNISSPSGVNLDPTTGVLTWMPSLSIGTYTITIGAYDMEAPGYKATTNLVVVVSQLGQPPTNVIISPVTQTVLEGATARFSASAAGTVPFAYQWYLKNAPIAGATNSTLTFTDVQPSDAGSNYFVVVSNPSGTATNLEASTLNVLTFTATHTSPAYGSPGICIVSCKVNYALERTLVDLLFEPTLPTGWTLQSVSGDGDPVIESGDIKFISGGTLPNPLNFSYTAAVPAGQSEPQSITNTGSYLLSGMALYSYDLVTPSPLVVKHGAFLTLSVTNDQWSINLLGDSGSNYVLQTSTDLLNWSSVATIVPIAGVVQTNLPISGSKMFFRSLLVE